MLSSMYDLLMVRFSASRLTRFLTQHLFTFQQDIPMGALVAVVVNRDAPPPGAGGNSSRGGRGKGNFRSKTRNFEPDNEGKAVATYSHYTVDVNDEGESAYSHRDAINNSQLIGYGVYNPNSMYRVRMLCHETIHPVLAKEIRVMRKGIQRGSVRDANDLESDNNDLALRSILGRKILDAIYLRTAMNLPSETTDTYRLLNGEGDGLSGLAVDILGGKTAIVMSSAAWVEIHKGSIMAVLTQSLKQHPAYVDMDIDIVWRNTPSRLNQDGYELGGDVDEVVDTETSVVATESSIKYLTYPYADGQKTGFYCDQRDNRLMVAELCENKRVLDLCCYNGGFALNAMVRGRASSAVGVDSSQDAVDAATANAELNGLDSKTVSFLRDDIASYMKTAMEANEEYDVIVLDPPKLAPSLSTLDKASRKYHALNRDAMNLMNKSQGGLILTCTCSAAMTQKDGGQYFLNMVNKAALSAKRRVTLLRVSGAAPCHTQSPASFPAGAYLTTALFHVGPSGL